MLFFFFLLACALPQEGQLPLQTPFQTWSWTRKWGFATQTHWSTTDTLMENGSIQLCFWLWCHKHIHGKGSLHAHLLPVPCKTVQFTYTAYLLKST